LIASGVSWYRFILCLCTVSNLVNIAAPHVFRRIRYQTVSKVTKSTCVEQRSLSLKNISEPKYVCLTRINPCTLHTFGRNMKKKDPQSRSNIGRWPSAWVNLRSTESCSCSNGTDYNLYVYGWSTIPGRLAAKSSLPDQTVLRLLK
jgi:hypothetical protein